MAVRPSDSRKVLITRVDNSLRLIVLQGKTPAKIVGGFGGWTNIQRKRNVSLTQFQGRDPFQMSLSLMFDGWMPDVSIEHDIRVLTYMALPPRGEKEPLPILIYGALPFPSGGSWVINGLEYGDEALWEQIQGEPARLRQDVTLTLLRYVRPDKVEFTDPGEGLAPKTPTVHIVVAGDSLRRLAQFYYGDYTRWHDIAAANALADPQHLVPGTKLRIP